VARLTYGKRAFLFTGDAEEPTEHALLAGGDLGADVLKVAHHGSGHSSIRAFLEGVHPSVAVISVGVGNDYGHPSDATLKRLQATGARVLRTDLDGEIRIRTDGEDLDIESSKTPAPPPIIAARPVVAPAPVPVTSGFVASKRGRVFHRSDCLAVEKLKARNRVRFSRRALALAFGLSPAKDCSP
jgi:competence protein ComEC